MSLEKTCSAKSFDHHHFLSSSSFREWEQRKNQPFYHIFKSQCSFPTNSATPRSLADDSDYSRFQLLLHDTKTTLLDQLVHFSTSLAELQNSHKMTSKDDIFKFMLLSKVDFLYKKINLFCFDCFSAQIPNRPINARVFVYVLN